MSKLLIVESPTKAKTISKFLSKDFKVRSSFGHIRDLPKSKIGIDVDNNFQPTYVIPAKSRKTANELKKLAQQAEKIYFATDEDREGEAISWHLAQIFNTPLDQSQRITFHEITEEAIKEALKNPRPIDLNLVDAQQARRILDRLVGYNLSPLLWKKVAKGLSAGRVQSVAVRLIVEKEREIENFKQQEYWEIFADFETVDQQNIRAKLHKIDQKNLDKFAITTDTAAQEINQQLTSLTYQISEIISKENIKNPLPPFTTASLQQEANRRLGFSAKQTMMLAQQLYEGIEIDGDSVGLITYMRTDSTNLAEKFSHEAGHYLKAELGEKYHRQRNYKTKSKGAQEAHEAIRPTSATRTPDQLNGKLNRNQFRLYQLIWQRAIASQMAPAILEATTIDIDDKDSHYSFRATGQVIKFDGFLKIYPSQTKNELLPASQKHDPVSCLKIEPIQKFTQPPARYSDATLVKALEEKGIGRPSTYAPTIATIIDRGYVDRLTDKRLKPTDIAKIVNDLLVEHFDNIVDYDFTAAIEEDFDKIAAGKKKWQPFIKSFYLPFAKNIKEKETAINKKEITEEKTDEKCEQCGSPMVIKIGRFGKFLACSNFPECKNTKNINPQGEIEDNQPKLLEEKCPDCGANLILRQGRYGQFKGCSAYPKCKFIKKEATPDLNINCPKCQNGKIISKRSRRGIFYGCDKYPDCDFAFWGKPTKDQCPKCGYPLTEDKKGTVKCSNKECQ
ncbi:MAG TPA: type I DNA topoisomerase [bacterium]|nr:type I DNA topoisomerase [bacterium]HNS33889.1 type I DNA topoisomerase [bacterium]